MDVVRTSAPVRENIDSTVLQLCNVVKRFGGITAVDGVSFAVTAGEVFTLLGPSGCGKTTTLRLAAGLEHPDEGEILLNGRLIVSVREGLFLLPERRNMGMVFQSYAIWPHLTVSENVAFPLRLRRWSEADIRTRVAETLEIVGLEGFQDRPVTALSGGQQQRIALARALSYRPEILLLDESLSNLDAKLREHTRRELRIIQQRLGITVLFVTHDQPEAMTLSDRIAVMNAGRLEQVGTPAEVYEKPATAFVRDFLGRSLIFEGVVSRDGDTALLELPGERTCSQAFLNFATGVLSQYVQGRSLVVSCRPDDVRLDPANATGPNRLMAVVEEVCYLGERFEYRVRTAGGRSLIVFSPRHERHSVGSTVGLVIDTRTAILWPQ
jgi:ABC-type Fe3+/spermidine/putrescine transport system ATPase subunit